MERVDDLQYKGLKLLQDDAQFCFGCDAVELANFADVKAHDNCVDLGCGNGIIPVLIAKKRDAFVTGVELQEAAASLAQRNVILNGLENKIKILNLRIQDIKEVLNCGSMSVVTCNPPYRKVGSGFKQEKNAVAIARHELEITLKEVVDAAAYLLPTKGRFYTVCQCERLGETLCLCSRAKLEPKILQILIPAKGKKPHLFLLKCVKDGKSGLEVLPQREIQTYGME